MSRELKIRIWDNEDKCYVGEPLDLYDIAFNEGLHWVTSGIKENKERYVIEQFTGIQDVKGVDVYEGDVTDEGEVVYINELIWDSGGSCHPGFYYHDEDYEGNMEYHCRLDSSSTIIGNVHGIMMDGTKVS